MKKALVIIIAVLLPFILAARSPKTIVVLTERGGQHESFAAAALSWLDSLASAEGYALKIIGDTRGIDSELLAGCDLFLQLDFPPYTWSESSKAAFEEFIDAGRGGWVGFHHATLLGDFDGWPMWEWFSDFMGGIRFRNYIAATASGRVVVENGRHPVMRGVSPSFVLPRDEWYTFDRSPRPNVQVLASVDEESYDPASDIRMGDHPVVWVNGSKKARNVYFLFGHSGELFSSPDFAKMFSNAIHWAIK